jgi:hypothetical protein
MFRPKLLAGLLPALLFSLLALARADSPKPLSEADLVKLIELQIDDQAVVARLEKGGVSFKVDSAAVTRLEKAGASAAVVAALQKLAEPKKATGPRPPEEEVVKREKRYVNVKILEPQINTAPLKEIFVVGAGTTQPIFPSEILVSREKYNQNFRLPVGRHFDVYWAPKEGKAICMIRNFTVDDANVVEIRPEEYIGFIRVTGKGLPPAKEIWVTPAGTTQPIFASEVVQQSKGYGENMMLPAGSYDIWLLPGDPPKTEKPEEKLKELLETNPTTPKMERLEEKLEVKPGKVKVLE